ncbi:hypothetical protein B0H16DRAFT_1690685 [Mycena metata]|uniref:Uncharacterized protein n=1 Tax=Mycena metata TaxID=1033252 RepID=A0AAD7J153_9AGAR|nr:hypothetical protein B0H16DRAFT_1690685 [Mycena metata]
MSSRATTPDDPLSDIFGAMDQESPVAPPRLEKRAHTALDDDSDEEDAAAATVQGSTSTPTVSSNAVVGACRYAEHKRLKTAQVAAVEAFLNDAAPMREVKVKLFIHLMHLENNIEKIVTATAPYTVSADTKKNIQNYATAVLLSSKTRTYKGSNATATVLALIQVHRGDLPAHIDSTRPTGASLKPHDSKSVENAASNDQLNIFQLAEAFVEGTRCSVNVPLCARIALMRKTFFKSPGAKFWDSVDGTLSKIRIRADGDNKKIAKAFRHILDNDQAKHGSADYRPEEETVDLFQQQVDDLIDANAADASSVAA